MSMFKTGNEGFGIVPNFEGEFDSIETVTHHSKLPPHFVLRYKTAEMRVIISKDDAENLSAWLETLEFDGDDEDEEEEEDGGT